LTPVEENQINKGYLQLIYPVPAKNNVCFVFNILAEDAVITFYDSSLKATKTVLVPAFTRDIIV